MNQDGYVDKKLANAERRAAFGRRWTINTAVAGRRWRAFWTACAVMALALAGACARESDPVIEPKPTGGHPNLPMVTAQPGDPQPGQSPGAGPYPLPGGGTLPPALLVATPGGKPLRIPLTLDPHPTVIAPATPLPGNAPWQPQPGDGSLSTGNVFIEELGILAQESYPPQYTLHLSGSLPTPCHQLRVAVSPPDARRQIEVKVYSLVAAEMMCVQVLKPFSASVPLNDLPAGKYSVWVNGVQAGNFTR
jgi:hypothetical protein